MSVARSHADPPPVAGPDGPICATTELAVAWCGHCRHPLTGHRQLRDRLSRRSRPRIVELDVTATFHARFAGHCACCERPFARGALIGATVHHDYICAECL